MSRLGSKTYSRKPECRTSVQFDHLLSDKSNKPSTAKVSVAGIQRWGMTSFTSIRKTCINGQKELAETVEPVKRVKLEPKPPSTCAGDPFGFESEVDISSFQHTNASTPTLVTDTKPAPPKPNKFFKSGGSRLLASRKNSPKNSDFDALRLSVSSNYQDKRTHDFLINMHSDYKSDVHIPSDDQHSVIYTSTTPNIMDLRFHSSVPSTCASNEYCKPHLSSPYIQSPAVLTDASSRAFDALRTLDLSTKNSNYQDCEDKMDTFCELPNYPMKETNLQMYSDNSANWDRELTNSEKLHNFLASENNSYFSKEETPPVKETDFTALGDSSGSEVEVLYTSTIQTELNSVPEVEKTGSDSDHLPSDRDSEFILSQSSDKSEDKNSAAKQLSRPKKIFSSSLKHKAVYNHRHWHPSKKEDEEDVETEQKVSLADEFEESNKEPFKDELIEEVANTSFGEIRSFKCPKSSKQLYTVVRNVKQAYQCHESGETQEFNDDIEYLLECVQECNGIGTRCLSVLNLASKCMGPAFRIHLRAHGTMPKIFSALKDASSDPNLALCTATLMFVLSQDRLTMDIEASTLSLMLELLETDPEMRSPEKEIDLILKDPALCAMQDKHREKVYQLCEEMKKKGHAKELKLNNINTGILAMETLLSLTSRKAGEWFKEEMRTLRGLDHITDTVTGCVGELLPEELEIVAHPTDAQLEKIRKIDRCLRVLENVTYSHFENQKYLTQYKQASFVETCVRLLQLFKNHLLQQKPINIHNEETAPANADSPILTCLLSLLKVLNNLTYENCLDDGPEGGLMDPVLMSILQVPRAVSPGKRFDLLVLALGLMINLVEYSEANRLQFIEMYALGSFDTVNDGYEMLASEALVELLLSRLDAATLSEEQADAILQTQGEKHAEKKDLETAAEELEETLEKTLQKAGKHMEHSMIAAYIALLLGFVIHSIPAFADVVKDHLPDGKFDVVVEVLRKFMSFVSLTGSIGNRGVKSIQRIIQVLESS